MPATKPPANPFLAALGARVRAARKDLHLSLEQLADRTGMSKAGLWQIERGRSDPGAGTLWRLARALRVSIDWVVTGGDRAQEREGRTMPRPEDFTPELKASCDAEMARYRHEQRRNPRPVPYAGRLPDDVFTKPLLREAWYCGAWLDRRLTMAGLPREKVRRVCYANGQRLATAADPWETTQRTLDDTLDAAGGTRLDRAQEGEG